MLIRPSLFLRRALLADGVVTGACALLMVTGGAFLAGLLGLPEPLLFYAGLGLVPYALIVGYLGTRESLPRGAVWAVIACNLLWALDCVALLAFGGMSPTWLGEAFVVVQILTVLVFAELQYMGLRRANALAAA